MTCVEINQCVGCTRQFFTKSYLGADVAALAPSSGEERDITMPSSRCRVDGVAMPVPYRSTEPGRPRHRREMHPTHWLISTQGGTAEVELGPPRARQVGLAQTIAHAGLVERPALTSF